MARCGWFARWVSLDTRSLALFRIVLGVVLLCDQLNNYGDIVTWLSDSGILPRYAVLEHHWAGEPWRWSGYLASGTDAFVMLVFHANLLTLCAFIVGFHTHAATIAAFVFQVSQHNRNELVRHAFDFLGGGLLFWSISLPLGAAFSVDAVREQLRPLRSGKPASVWLGAEAAAAPPRDGARSVLSVGSVALWLQVWVMYFCAMSSKTDKAWTRDHTALQLAIQVGYLARQPIAAMVLRQEGLCRLLTALTFPAEYVLPLMLLLPLPPPLQLPIRLPAMLGMAGFHFGIGLTMELGEIPWLNISAILPFLPPAAWELIDTQLLPRLRKPRRGPSRHLVLRPDEPLAALAIALVFETQRIALGRPGALCLTTRTDLAKNGGGDDDDVDVGDGGEHGMLSAEDDEEPLLPSDGNGGNGGAAADAEKGAAHGGAAAAAPVAPADAAALARELCVLSAVGAGGRAGTWRARWAAAKRRLLCGGADLGGALWRALTLWTLCAVVWWNLHGVGWAPAVRPSFALPLQVFNLHQSFKVFAPRPPTEDYYVLMPGTLEDGSKIDVVPALRYRAGRHFDHTEPPDWRQPTCHVCDLRTDRWAKLFENLMAGWGTDQAKKPRVEAQRLTFGKWVCRTWNANHPKETKRQLLKWQLTFIRLDNKKVLPMPEDGSDLKKPMLHNSTVWYHNCF